MGTLPSVAADATFNRIETLTNQYANALVTADLNGDGLPDLVGIYSRVNNTFSVQLANGDGTFAKPVSYTLPVNQQYPMYIATADINNDGKADVILATGDDLSVYFGRGDGTLATPRNTTLPGLAAIQLIVSDFNHDGKPDAALAMGRSVVVMWGDGQGGFSAPVNILTVTDNQGFSAMAAGDFDSDANADIAVGVSNGPCNPGGCDHTDVHILYGSGSISFADKTLYGNVPNFFLFSSGDLNGDGRTDLAGFFLGPKPGGENTLILYGHPTRTVTAKYLTANGPTETTHTATAIADLNGDGRTDFALLAANSSNKEAIDLFLRGTSRGYAFQEVIFGDNTFEIGNPVVGDFNGDQKTDLVVAAKNDLINSDQLTRIYAYLNTTSATRWPPCDYPKAARGINVCNPVNGATVGSNVQFKIAATWFQPIRKIEVWVDGTKVNEQHHVWDKYGWLKCGHSFAPGSHRADIYTAGYDNALQRQSLTFTVR